MTADRPGAWTAAGVYPAARANTAYGPAEADTFQAAEIPLSIASARAVRVNIAPNLAAPDGNAWVPTARGNAGNSAAVIAVPSTVCRTAAGPTWTACAARAAENLRTRTPAAAEITAFPAAFGRTGAEPGVMI